MLCLHTESVPVRYIGFYTIKNENFFISCFVLLFQLPAGGLKRYVFASDATGDEAKMLVSSMQLQNNDVNGKNNMLINVFVRVCLLIV